MNRKEQRMKLWCDVFTEILKYNNKTVSPLNRVSCKQKADEAVKIFDERFNTTKTTLKDNGLVPEPPKTPQARTFSYCIEIATLKYIRFLKRLNIIT